MEVPEWMGRLGIVKRQKTVRTGYPRWSRVEPEGTYGSAER
jgi:hypothetical protein